MIEYVDLVLVRHFNSPALFLFRAPAFSGIKKRDVVFCETINGDSYASYGMVMAVDSVPDGGSAFDLVVTACNATLPLKRILRYGNMKDFTWEDENGTDQN